MLYRPKNGKFSRTVYSTFFFVRTSRVVSTKIYYPKAKIFLKKIYYGEHLSILTLMCVKKLKNSLLFYLVISKSRRQSLFWAIRIGVKDWYLVLVGRTFYLGEYFLIGISNKVYGVRLSATKKKKKKKGFFSFQFQFHVGLGMKKRLLDYINWMCSMWRHVKEIKLMNLCVLYWVLCVSFSRCVKTGFLPAVSIMYN